MPPRGVGRPRAPVHHRLRAEARSRRRAGPSLDGSTEMSDSLPSLDEIMPAPAGARRPGRPPGRVGFGLGSPPGVEGGYGVLLVDPPWRYRNRTGKVAPEHKRLMRYRTMTAEEITALPVAG